MVTQFDCATRERSDALFYAFQHFMFQRRIDALCELFW